MSYLAMLTYVSRPAAVFYIRVSSEQHVQSRASLIAEEGTLAAEAERRGYVPLVVRQAGKRVKDMRRPELLRALDLLDRGHASLLLATRVDRVSRSVRNFATLMEGAQREGWAVAFTGTAIYMTSKSGMFTAHVLSVAAS